MGRVGLPTYLAILFVCLVCVRKRARRLEYDCKPFSLNFCFFLVLFPISLFVVTSNNNLVNTKLRTVLMQPARGGAAT